MFDGDSTCTRKDTDFWQNTEKLRLVRGKISVGLEGGFFSRNSKKCMILIKKIRTSNERLAKGQGRRVEVRGYLNDTQKYADGMSASFNV